MKIAIVGAGATGLVSAKYSLQYGYECDVFEQTGSLGGTWVYNDSTTIDEDGIEVQSTIYKDLIINAPKELMEYSDFAYPTDIQESYIGHNLVLAYLRAYSEHFHVEKHIQYFTRVKRITPVDGGKWDVVVQHLKAQTEKSMLYDAVFVCNGRFKSPFIPKIMGQDVFRGTQLHSRSFRVPEPYEGQNVVLVGGHRSGIEISTRIAKFAKHVFLSCRNFPNMVKPPNLLLKPEISELGKTQVTFSDGTVEECDTIVYCTGYLYTCDFLSNKCGLKVENNGVAPLYKQIINIEHPTMFFIGLPYLGSSNAVFDLQVRFAMAALRKTFILPSKKTMLKEWDIFLATTEEENRSKKHVHRLCTPQKSEKYSTDIAATSNITPIIPAYFKMYARVIECNRAHYLYKFIDDETFVEIIPNLIDDSYDICV
ncbi:hypothetical protein RI129_003940 [Pyrocoelia pectoralis]|uniref:Flavin-containing monooxygenase n=1 Tax=Pyrocoelia pectoralis TaxID=417401 RepID=A0AAN7VTC8_9COLE